MTKRSAGIFPAPLIKNGSVFDIELVDKQGNIYAVSSFRIHDVILAWAASRDLWMRISIEDTEVGKSNFKCVQIKPKQKGKDGVDPKLKIKSFYDSALNSGELAIRELHGLIKDKEKYQKDVMKLISDAKSNNDKSLQWVESKLKAAQFARDSSFSLCLGFGAGQIGSVFSFGEAIGFGYQGMKFGLFAEEAALLSGAGFGVFGWLGKAAGKYQDTNSVKAAGTELVVGGISACTALVGGQWLTSAGAAKDKFFSTAAGVIVVTYNFSGNVVSGILSGYMDETLDNESRGQKNNDMSEKQMNKIVTKTTVNAALGVVNDLIGLKIAPFFAGKYAFKPFEEKRVEGAVSSGANVILGQVSNWLAEKALANKKPSRFGAHPPIDDVDRYVRSACLVKLN